MRHAAGFGPANEGRELFASPSVTGHVIVENTLGDGPEIQVEVIERAKEFTDRDEMGFGTPVAKTVICGAEVGGISEAGVDDAGGILFEQ